MEAATVTPPPDEPPKQPTATPAAAVVQPPQPQRERARRPTKAEQKAADLATLEDRLVVFFGQVQTHRFGDEEVQTCTGIAGMAWIFDPQDGIIIASNSENMAKAWANLAKQNERVARILNMMLSGGAWGEVFFATSPVIFGIMANHGIGLAALGFGPTEGPDAPEQSGEPGRDPTGTVGATPPGL